MNHLAANSQSCTCVMYVLVCSLGSISMIGKKPPVARKLSEDGPFELHFERNYDLTPAIFCGED